MRDEGGSWVLWRPFGLWVALQILVLMGLADGEERFRAGMKDVTLAAGYSISHNLLNTGNPEKVEGVHLLPHFGYVLTDEHGSGWMRGNFELLVEPVLIHLEDGDSATVAGWSTLGRWVFTGWSVARPYFEVGLGVVGGQVNLPETNCDVNFVIQGGPGVLFFVSRTTAVMGGYRIHHVSNSALCSKNRGLNSSLFIVGLSQFFP